MKFRHGSPKIKQKITPKPLEPCVTMEQIIAFDPTRPETATPSPLMNQILAAMHVVCPLSAQSLGRYLKIEPKGVCFAIKLLTGITYSEVREKWAQARAEILKKAHPDWSMTQIANAVGYATHTALWRTYHRSKRREEYRDMRNYIEFMDKKRQQERKAEQARMEGE